MAIFKTVVVLTLFVLTLVLGFKSRDLCDVTWLTAQRWDYFNGFGKNADAAPKQGMLSRWQYSVAVHKWRLVLGVNYQAVDPWTQYEQAKWENDFPTERRVRRLRMDSTVYAKDLNLDKFSLLKLGTDAKEADSSRHFWTYQKWVHFPLWYVTILTGFFVAYYSTGHIRQFRRWKNGWCKHCGYDLRASTGRCPECGKEFVRKGEAGVAVATTNENKGTETK